MLTDLKRPKFIWAAMGSVKETHPAMGFQSRRPITRWGSVEETHPAMGISRGDPSQKAATYIRIHNINISTQYIQPQSSDWQSLGGGGGGMRARLHITWHRTRATRVAPAATSWTFKSLHLTQGHSSLSTLFYFKHMITKTKTRDTDSHEVKIQLRYFVTEDEPKSSCMDFLGAIKPSMQESFEIQV